MRIRSLLSACYKTKERMRARIGILIYNLHTGLLYPIIRKRRPLRLMFYVNNLSMWKSDKLLLLLKQDERFCPFVVTHLYPKDTDQMRRDLEQDIYSHFKALGVDVESGYDFSKNRLYPVKRFSPDMVFFPQPYLNNLSMIPFKVLLSYIPYCFEMEDYMRFYNSMYQNICWKIFVPTELHKQLKIKHNYNHGSNVVVSGNPLADYFFDGHTPSEDIWPVCNPKLKRIIWAPHHSIFPDDWLDYSNFLEIADSMVEIARRYSDKVQFVFKPHPMLREKLYRAESWGFERTDAYYNSWKEMPNTAFANGNYVDLFMTSDALIHDCSSFTAEYLYVNKPVMFVSGKDKIDTFNSFADECFRMHYHGSSVQDIESFIRNVIEGVDPMEQQRSAFIKENLLPKENKTVAQTIYDELCKLFE